MLEFLWRCRRGQALVEMALALPVFLLMVTGAIDMGMLFLQYVSMGHAAEAAAQTAAELLSTSGFPLQAAGIPAWVVRQAESAALKAAPVLQASRLSLEVAWDGPAQSAQRPSPPYRFQVTVPDTPNTYRNVNLGHQHDFGYSQPRVYGYDVWDPYRPGVWYPDNSADAGWRYFSFPHNQGYWDLAGPYTWQGYPWGLWSAALFMWPYFGWAGGVYLPWRTYVQGAWNPWWWRGTSWAYPGAWGTTVGPVQDAWRRTSTDLFWNPDQANASWWQGFGGTFDPADPWAYVGQYALRQGDRSFIVENPNPAMEEFTSRPVRAVVRYQVQAFTPLLAPILNGKTLSRLAVARAAREEAR